MISSLRQANLKLSADLADLEQRFEAAQGEIIRLKERLEEYEAD